MVPWGAYVGLSVVPRSICVEPGESCLYGAMRLSLYGCPVEQNLTRPQHIISILPSGEHVFSHCNGPQQPRNGPFRTAKPPGIHTRNGVVGAHSRQSAGRFPSMGANMLAYLSKRGKKRTPYPLVSAYSGSEEARITVWRVGGLL